jgi:hypothetical protein
MKRGNCYVTCEALYHLLGGKKVGLKPMFIRHEGQPHWFLRCTSANIFSGHEVTVDIDPTSKQFKTVPDYSKGKGKGFLTKKPSKRARALMKTLLWQEVP